VVEAKLVEQGGLVVVGSDFVDGGTVADFVGFAVNGAWLEAAAGKPGAKTLAIVVSAGFAS